MNKYMEEAKKITKYIQNGEHIEYSVGNIANKQYDIDINQNMLEDNMWMGVVSRKQIPALGKGSSKGQCGAARWIWIDLDRKTLSNPDEASESILERIRGILEPSLIINSGHGFHCYWFLTNPETNYPRLEKLMERMIPVFGADPARKNINSMMRVPGSINKKEGMEPVRVEVVHTKNVKYDIQFLENKFPEISKQIKKSDFFKQIEEPYNGTVNNSLYRETLMLLEKGWSIDTVYEQMEAKYKALGEDHHRFENTFQSALKKFDVDNVKNPSIVRNNKIKSEVMQALNSGNVETALNKLERLQDKPIEIMFDEYDGSLIAQDSRKIFKIGHSEFDSYSPFESATTCIIAGLTGQGKTTVALNLLKAFSENNESDILFLESDSETSSLDIKRLAHQIGVKKLTLTTFPRFEDMKKGFMNILNKYKESKNKYPDIVFIDTFEKMNMSSENYALKLNTEAMSFMSQETKCLFISLSQFSSSQYKTSKKTMNYYPMTIQQGGMDVINNVNTWISMKRHIERGIAVNSHYNNFYFGKVRSALSSVNIYDKVIQVPFRMEDFNLIFKNIEIKEAEI